MLCPRQMELTATCKMDCNGEGSALGNLYWVISTGQVIGEDEGEEAADDDL